MTQTGEQLVSDGFRVDLAAVAQTVAQVRALMDTVDEHDTDGLNCDFADFGDPTLAGVAHEFCARWRSGINYLVRDGRAVARRLSTSASKYQEADEKLAEAMRKILAEGQKR